MDRRFLNATSSLAHTALKLCTVVAKYWRTRTARVDQGYRPELHYMRGPDPKWREADAPARHATGANRSRSSADHIVAANRSISVDHTAPERSLAVDHSRAPGRRIAGTER